MAQYYYGQSSNPQSGKSKGSGFIIGRVKSIVLSKNKYDGTPNEEYKNPKDLGKITYEILYTNISVGKSNVAFESAYPIFSFIRQYPLISEIVYIVPGPSSNLNESLDRQEYYYFPPYSIWNSLNHNAFPNMEEYAETLRELYNSDEYSNKLRDAADFPSLPVGITFSENTNIRSLKPFEGDTIIESRFGQSIRFSSTILASKTQNPWSNSGAPGSPITIIRNGQGQQKSKDYFEQTVEDINVDDSTIWMTSGQEINIKDISSFPLKSFGITAIESKSVIKKYSVATSNSATSAASQDIANLK
jgi:hypothetical protein